MHGLSLQQLHTNISSSSWAWTAALRSSDQPVLGMWLQAQAQAQAQNMAFQAHNLQAHAQQLEVESAHPVSSHINVGLQHQLDQVYPAIRWVWPTNTHFNGVLLTGYIVLQLSVMSSSTHDWFVCAPL